MKLIPMEYKACFAVKENPQDTVRIDEAGERILISEKENIDLGDIAGLQRFEIGYSKVVKSHLFKEDEYGPARYLNVIAIRRSGGAWIFLCDSRELFCGIAKEFERTYELSMTVSGKEWVSGDGEFSAGAYVYKTYTETRRGRMGYNIKRFMEDAVKTYDAKREFAKYLLGASKEERINSAKGESSYYGRLRDAQMEARVTGCRFEFSDDNMKYFDSETECCLIFDDLDVETLYRRISRLKPERREATREMERLKAEYGTDFTQKEEVLKKFRTSLKIEDIPAQLQKNGREIDDWRARRDEWARRIEKISAQKASLDKRMRQIYDYERKRFTERPLSGKQDNAARVAEWIMERQHQEEKEQAGIRTASLERDLKEWTDDEEFAGKYVQVLLEKQRILEEEYYNGVCGQLKKLDFEPAEEEKCRNRLLDRLKGAENVNRSELEGLYRDYDRQERQLKETARTSQALQIDIGGLELPRYIEFYAMGKALIAGRLNQIGGENAKREEISQGQSDRAMMYFYGTASPREAYEKQREAKYLDDQKKGEKGEREVEHALKWLDKNKYLVVPRLPGKRHNQVNTIELYNGEFIDESQQFDHIVIGRQGVFMIETKDYAGKLIIDSNGNWIRIKKYGVEEGEKNPVAQVDRHIKLLKSFLGDGIPIMGIICIANSGAVIEGVENCPVKLVKHDLLVRTIEDWPVREGGKALSEEEMRECLALIESHRL